MTFKLVRILISMLCLSVIFGFYPGESQPPPGMVLVKGGLFQMGSHEIPGDEEPVHPVTVNSFYIGTFEVTQAEWTAIMGNNPAVSGGDQLPVENVDWYDAVEFCNKKSKIEGLTPCYKGSSDNIDCNFNANGYRLPTEAEWEYAGRGGVKSRHYKYSGSNNADEIAWYEVNSGCKTRSVGQRKPNELGIYDMSGNVWEWCWDRYDPTYYKNSPLENPRGPSSGENRSYRGGSNSYCQVWLRSNARLGISPTYKSFDMGFRVVRNSPGLHQHNPAPGMVFVKGGGFEMGSSAGNSGEKVVHPVTLSSFYIGKFEVTQEEWKTVMGNNPSIRLGNISPVHFVNWHDAVEYCNKRSQIEGLTPGYTGKGHDITCNFRANGYRLPTEAEWEYAARGGLQSRNYKFSGSNNADEVALYEKNLLNYFEPVGQRKPNELGIYDMSGNMWEWCWDWYDFDFYKKGVAPPTYYCIGSGKNHREEKVCQKNKVSEGINRNSPKKNPRGPLAGLRRVARGGGWNGPENDLWSSGRSCFEPHQMSLIIGFRVVRTAK